jgi:hypothetical protein
MNYDRPWETIENMQCHYNEKEARKMAKTPEKAEQR